jgi:NAD(P)-dependent dehydrogenase (short-subunit alcohol dehydrogenase family)
MPEALEQFPALKERLSRVPLQRSGKYEDIVGGVIYLASDASSYVTGANFIIDGGMTAILG